MMVRIRPSGAYSLRPLMVTLVHLVRSKLSFQCASGKCYRLDGASHSCRWKQEQASYKLHEKLHVRNNVKCKCFLDKLIIYSFFLPTLRCFLYQSPKVRETDLKATIFCLATMRSLVCSAASFAVEKKQITSYHSRLRMMCPLN